MGYVLDDLSEPEKSVEGARWIEYKDSVVGVGGFPLLLALLIVLYSEESSECETASTSVLS
jgi:hypothetical protein